MTNMVQPLYLDNNATTPMFPEVVAAMEESSRKHLGNPASPHAAGRHARRALEEARAGITQILGGRTSGPDADRLVFTSGGTEANNLALRGLGGPGIGHLVLSAVEHPSSLVTAEQLKQQGWTVDLMPVDRHGRLQIETLAGCLIRSPKLVSVMLGNNETGVLQPVRLLASRCASSGVLVHTDAVQAVGKIRVDFRQLGVAALSCSAHKFHGPVGIGALLVRGDVPLEPMLFGGFQQSGLRPGTEPVTLAVGMHSALSIWHRQWRERTARLTKLRDLLEYRLMADWPDGVVHGAQVERLPHTTNFSFPGLDRQVVLMALDASGLACSTGSACASGSSEPSHVLLAMGCRPGLIRGSLRFSLSLLNTPNHVNQAADRILRVCKRLRQEKDHRKLTDMPP